MEGRTNIILFFEMLFVLYINLTPVYYIRRSRLLMATIKLWDDTCRMVEVGGFDSGWLSEGFFHQFVCNRNEFVKILFFLFGLLIIESYI